MTALVLARFGHDDMSEIVLSMGPDALKLLESMPEGDTWDPHTAAGSVLDMVTDGLSAAGLDVPSQVLGLIRPLVGLLMAEIYKTHLVADGGITAEGDMT